MLPFNYHHLYYFFVIAQEGSISKAAAGLKLAQPTLSAQLKQFEDFLNTKLFLRENRKLSLTDEGRKVLSYAKMIFDIGQELKDKMADLSDLERPRLTLGISSYVPKTIVELLLNYVLQKAPGTYLSLKKGPIDFLLQELNDHVVDFILTDSPFETSVGDTFSNTFIGKIPIVFCSNNQIAKKIRRFPEDLNGMPLLLPTVPKQVSYAIKEYLYENHIEPKIVAELEDLEILRRLVLRGHGIGTINLLTVEQAPAKQKLVILNKDEKYKLYEKVFFITKKRKAPRPIVEKIKKEFRFEY